MTAMLRSDQDPATLPENLIYDFPIMGTMQDANGNDVDVIVDTQSATPADLDRWDAQQDEIKAAADAVKADTQAKREAIAAIA